MIRGSSFEGGGVGEGEVWLEIGSDMVGIVLWFGRSDLNWELIQREEGADFVVEIVKWGDLMPSAEGSPQTRALRQGAAWERPSMLP